MPSIARTIAATRTWTAPRVTARRATAARVVGVRPFPRRYVPTFLPGYDPATQRNRSPTGTWTTGGRSGSPAPARTGRLKPRKLLRAAGFEVAARPGGLYPAGGRGRRLVGSGRRACNPWQPQQYRWAGG